MCDGKAGDHGRSGGRRSPDFVEDDEDQGDADQEAQGGRVKHHTGGLHHRVHHGAVILQRDGAGPDHALLLRNVPETCRGHPQPEVIAQRHQRNAGPTQHGFGLTC